MRSRTAVGTLLLPLLAALACAGGEQAEQQETATQGMEAASEAAMPAAMTLAALNNSGISGTARLSHSQNALAVTLNLTGLTAGESYPAHVHRGSCQQDGPVLAPIGSATAASDGTGTIEASIPMDEFQMTEGMKEGEHAMAEGEHAMEEGEAMMQEGQEATEYTGYSVRVHMPDGTPAACTEIKAKTGGMM